MDARVAKYAKERCCVCGKYGADRPFGEPVAGLKMFAKAKRLTIALPESEAIHDKCLARLKQLLLMKRIGT